MLSQEQAQNDDASELEHEGEEEEEVEKLEEEVKEMAEKILEYRKTLPDEVNNTLTTLLAAQRPIFQLPPTRSHDPPDSQPGLSSSPRPDYHPDSSQVLDLGKETPLVGENQEDAEKLQLLKQKISSNASTIPIVLKRMKECMSRMDKLQSYDGVIHPAFKRKRPS